MKKSIQRKLDINVIKLFENSKDNDSVSVIVFADGRNKDRVRQTLEKSGCKLKYELDIINGYAVEACSKSLLDIADCEHVMYIAGDIKAKTCLDIARKSIGADSCKDNITGKNIGVAVIDTGIYPHENIKNNIVHFVDFVDNKKKAYDDNGHGTHCAGIIASSDERYKGIAPGANLIGLKVMNANGEGDTSNILAAMNWVGKNAEIYNIRVVSMSLGAQVNSYIRYDPMIMAAEKLWSEGIIVVAAAGNEGPDYSTISSPGAGRNLITVGCSDDKNTAELTDDSIADFSSRGPSRYAKSKPDIVAPGVDIVSLANSSKGFITMSGTSMSAPVVSGCCALILEKYPDLKPDEVKQRLIKNAYSLRETKLAQGSGVVNLRNILY